MFQIFADLRPLATCAIAFVFCSLHPVRADAQSAPAEAAEASDADETWSLHGQTTFIFQHRGSVRSPYRGENSFGPNPQDRETWTATAFLGRRLWDGGALFWNPESTQGHGLNDVTGIAGFVNGEGSRAGSDEPRLSTARLFFRQTFGLGGGREKVEDDANKLGGEIDVSRVTITAGKFAAIDVFDDNAFSHDARTQFLNWALVANGAWDFPADAKGYSWGVAAELNQPDWAMRAGAFLLPRKANGKRLDGDPSRALGGVVEFEVRPDFGLGPAKLKALAYANHAHMGSYERALALAPTAPDVTATRAYRTKFGFGLNLEQPIGDDVGLFARVGRNDGRSETWAYTEIDRTLSVGASVRGAAWNRNDDTVGVALVVNGLARDHRRYIAAGGLGFILGDGRLAYAPERILEAYYRFSLIKPIDVTLDVQHVDNPAYNRDRGPADIVGGRLHVEF
ncbi:MAG: hypothetical protein JWM77_3056 [Rhodospirillales bacterium]|nr:hypothetical protein [Rhodospirillales bacterium]